MCLENERVLETYQAKLALSEEDLQKKEEAQEVLEEIKQETEAGSDSNQEEESSEFERKSDIAQTEIEELLKKVKCHGLAQITGGGLRNLPRLNKNVKFVIDDPFEPQPIFKFLQKYGNIENREMYQTFNMGMGFSLVITENDVNETIKILKKHSTSEAKVVGKIEKGKGVELQNLGLSF